MAERTLASQLTRYPQQVFSVAPNGDHARPGLQAFAARPGRGHGAAMCHTLCALILSSNGWAASPEQAPRFSRVDFVLPGARGTVSLDYFIFDSANHRLWVPASNTGAVTIIDDDTDQVTSLTGFRTAQVDFMGKRPV